MENNDIFAVIMAGGKGERFWPQSRKSRPKQLLKLISKLTLIEQTVNRLKPLVPSENIIIITNVDYVDPMHELLTDIPKENIIGEPVGRDTAPCVALAAAIVGSKSDNPNATMILLPADHVINDSTSMQNTLKECAQLAMEGKVVTIGINPDAPSTGYGYIKCEDRIESETKTKFYISGGFREKPDKETAKSFIADGSYKWNSGMFIWSVGTIMDAFKKFTPKLAIGAEKLKESILNNTFDTELAIQFKKFDKVSIDYAIMEKVENIIVAESTFDWDDVGSWPALRNQIKPNEDNNIVKGLHVGVDTKDSIIVSDSDHLIATIGVDDMIIVHTEDATLVCKTNSAQKVKDIVHKLENDDTFKGFL